MAPSAKMNRQRTRRFRLADSLAKETFYKKFDMNSITPGTEFMAFLHTYIRQYISERKAKNSLWKNIQVTLSDANVPGEGEHKIYVHIREQKRENKLDPAMKHVIYGNDIDLILRALTLHLPNFLILKEDFQKPSKKAACSKCGKFGHIARNCRLTSFAAAKSLRQSQEASSPLLYFDIDALTNSFGKIFRSVIAEYDLDEERLIDDWLCMLCFWAMIFSPNYRP